MVRGNLSERVFLLELNLTMANIFNYDRLTKQHSYIANCNLVAGKVAARKICVIIEVP